jgi:pimeloyl-ACP methyl ester carboxylesterase
MEFIVEQHASRATLGRPRWLRNLSIAVLLFSAIDISLAAAAVQEETLRIPGSLPGLQLGLRHVFSSEHAPSASLPTLLMLHGAGVPVSGNPGYRFAGGSMMSSLANAKLDVWALDFYGFGDSDRYPEMTEAPDRHPALGRAEECADQVESVVAYLRQRLHIANVLLLGDSGGSIVAGVFAARHPELVSRLVLFGPMTPFSPSPPIGSTPPAYITMTPQDLWSQFSNWADATGTPSVFESGEYARWAKLYLDSDPSSRTRTPPSVKIPNGRQADALDIARGKYPFDPSQILAPTLIVMGEWDEIATLPGAEWLLHSLRRARERQLIVIGHGSHTIQYEKERTQLYRTVSTFLTATIS